MFIADIKRIRSCGQYGCLRLEETWVKEIHDYIEDDKMLMI